MKISDMIKREDLTEILISTLPSFFEEIYNYKVKIYKDPCHESIPFYLTLTPGCLAGSKLPNGAFETINAEYTPRGSIIKVFVIRASLIPGLFFRKFASKATLYISGLDRTICQSIYIVPNNKTIRVFDYNENSVYSYLKSGFRNDFMENQITFRKAYSYDFMNPMTDSGTTWFKEPILRGHALARTRDAQKYKNALKTAISCIDALFDKTQIEKSVGEYVHEIMEKATQICKNYENEIDISKIINGMNALIHGVNIESKIRIGITHGDFQEGNIWCEKTGKTIIYDWETVGLRSMWFDRAVLYYKLHNNCSYGRFMECNDLILLFREEQEACRGLELEQIKRIVILEDILFQLQEVEVLTKNACHLYLFRLISNVHSFENMEGEK